MRVLIYIPAASLAPKMVIVELQRKQPLVDGITEVELQRKQPLVDLRVLIYIPAASLAPKMVIVELQKQTKYWFG